MKRGTYKAAVSDNIAQCYLNPDWKKLGQARVGVMLHSKNTFAAAIFLVDLFCLGVKDVMGGFRSKREFEMFLPSMYFDRKPRIIPFDFAKDIIWGAVRYARSFGFNPHPDFI